MASRIRRLASETAVYGISSVVGRLINFLLFPLYSQVFDPDVYQPIVVLYAAFVFLNILFQHGMESAYLKFATDRDELTKRSAAFSTAMASVAAIGSALAALIWLLPGPVSTLIELDVRYESLLFMGAGILFMDAMAVVPFADLRLRNRAWHFAGIRLANIAVNVTMNLVLIFGMDMGVEAVLIANLLASGLTLVLLSPTVLARFSTPDAGLWKQLMRFGLPFIPGGLGYAVTERINIFFLGKMDPARAESLYGLDVTSHPELHARAAEQGSIVFTEFVTGAYGGIVKLAVLMALFVQMFRYAWQPFFLQHQKDEDAPELYGRIFGLLTWVLVLAFLAVSFFAQELVQFPLPGERTLIAPSFWLGLHIIPIALAGYVFQGWYYHFSAGAYIKDQSRYFLHATLVGSVIALGLNAWLVPTWGMVAAASATSVAYAAMAITLLILIRPHYPVPYAWGRILPFMGLGAAVFFGWFAVESLQVWWIEGAMILAVAVSGLAMLGWKPADLRALKG